MAAILLDHDGSQRRPSLVSARPTIVYEKNGRRRVRRKDNSRFAGNEHIVEPSSKDYEPTISLPRTTFPTPVPSFISRADPSIFSIPCRDPITANAGRYSLSLKGIRKRLRRAGPRTEQLVSDIDKALITWLHTDAVIIQPDLPFTRPLDAMGIYVDSSQSIQEISRSVLQLVWRVDEDFSRFLLHCVARYYGIVSYSKTINDAGRDIRVTYLLRPNATRPDFRAASRLETPPATDIEALSTPAETDNSEPDAWSDTSDVIGDDFREGKMDNAVLSTVPEEEYAEEVGTYMEPNDDSGVIALPTTAQLHEDNWSEDNERPENHKIRNVGTDSLPLEVRLSRINIATRRQNSRSVSSPSRSPRRPYGKRFLLDKQLKFWHYVYG